VETYAANGFGVGLGLYVPKTQYSREVKLIPLTEFPPVVVGAMWAGKRTPLMDAFVAECHRRAEYLREPGTPPRRG
jgi:DNA-binding transcriptional LysR family regulator